MFRQKQKEEYRSNEWYSSLIFVDLEASLNYESKIAKNLFVANELFDFSVSEKKKGNGDGDCKLRQHESAVI